MPINSCSISKKKKKKVNILIAPKWLRQNNIHNIEITDFYTNYYKTKMNPKT